MDNIELSKQTSTRSYTATATDQGLPMSYLPSDHHSDRGDKDNDSTIHHSQLSSSSIIPERESSSVAKKSFGQRLKAKLPPLPLARAIVKASIAVLISLLFVFEENCRIAAGAASILVPIGTILNFPIRPLGVQIEATIQGLLGALIGAAWCFLGMYLGNLARDTGNPHPVQPNSSAVLSIFMFIGVFGLTYVRIQFTQANFATIFASIIVAFALTQASITPGFQPAIVYTFLKPLAIASAIALMVDAFLWPEDSITKYMGVLNKSLKEYNNFFQEHSDAFLSTNTSSFAMTLPTLHARLQNSVLKLIDTKREVQREVLFNRISQNDISDITRIVKTMRTPLHGIGLSLITKTEQLKQLNRSHFGGLADDNYSEHKKQFLEGLEEMRKVGQELSDTCVMTLNECNERLMKFSGRPRSLRSTLFWPFPRVYLRDYYRSKKMVQEQEQEYVHMQSLSHRLDLVIGKYEAESRKSSRIFIEPGSDQFEERFNSILQIIYLFQYNLREHALQLKTLVACVENLETSRTTRRLWLPHLSLRKWFRSLSVNANLGGQVGSAANGPDTNSTTNGGNDLTLCQTMTRPDAAVGEEGVGLAGRTNRLGKVYPRDPDVNPPETAAERFFYGLFKFVYWLKSMEAMFALKTAGGFVLLSLPAFLPQSAGWFFAWRGQWATVTLMMWMFPMAGMFAFTIILRVMGTVLGGVLGIIVWEIARGNPYGVVILTFFVMMPLYFVFFTSQIFNIVAIMTQITLLLVICYEYQYVVSGTLVYDSVEMVAGKRMMLVIIGVGASAILAMIPKPITGRVELRKRISRTIQDLSKLYGILVGDILYSYDNNHEPTPRQRKAFRKLTLGIRRQIADEQTYLKLSKLEPPLRGKFPVEIYAQLVEKVDNMADLLQGMAFSSRSVDKAWRRNLVEVIKEERMDYLASIFGLMKLLSSVLASKMALPPFMLSPLELRARFAQRLGHAITKSPEQLDNDTFPSYCAYAVNAYKFSTELEQVLECIEKLVGVEDPEQWLLINA